GEAEDRAQLHERGRTVHRLGQLGTRRRRLVLGRAGQIGGQPSDLGEQILLVRLVPGRAAHAVGPTISVRVGSTSMFRVRTTFASGAPSEGVTSTTDAWYWIESEYGC